MGDGAVGVAALSRALLAPALLSAALVAAALASPGVPAAEEDGSAAARALIREGIRHLESGNVERAARQFERAVQIAPSDPAGYIHLARARGAGQRFAEAHKVLAKALIHAHADPKILYSIEIARGDLYRDEGKIDPARAAYEKARELRFFNREARDRLRALDAPPAEEPPEPPED